MEGKVADPRRGMAARTSLHLGQACRSSLTLRNGQLQQLLDLRLARNG